MLKNIKIATLLQKMNFRRHFGLAVGLLISLSIIKEGIIRLQHKDDQKKEVVSAENLQYESFVNSSLLTENKFKDKFPEISGLAKMLIVTIHAPWIFNNQKEEDLHDGEEKRIFFLNSFFSKFSFPILKERSELEEPGQVPVS